MKPWGQQGKRIIWNSKNQTRTNTQIIRRLSQAKNHSSSGTLMFCAPFSVILFAVEPEPQSPHTQAVSPADLGGVYCRLAANFAPNVHSKSKKKE